MSRFNVDDVICHVHTRKEGLLSRIAHDLCFSVDNLDVKLDGKSGEAEIDPMRIRLLGAKRNDVVDPKVLSAGDRKRVLANLRNDVLNVAKFPQISYRWRLELLTPTTVTLQGSLSLHGVERPLVFRGAVDGDIARLTARFDQRDFGIVPFRAAFGALKVHPELRIELTVPLTALD